MRILYIHPGKFPPELHAGSGLAMDWLCRMLVARGHKVVVTAQSPDMPPLIVDVGKHGGYPVMRSSDLGDALRRAGEKWGRPDVIVGSHVGPWLRTLVEMIADVPLVIYEHEVSNGFLTVADLKARMSFIANSETTAKHLRQNLGVACTVVPPLFGVDQYAGLKPKGDKVLFVSLQPRKGADIAVGIAQGRPKTEFIFVETWTRRPDRTDVLREIVGKMPNVTLLANQPGLGEVYPQIKLLLMPSRGQESWGRTATEAQMCGIPVLGSNRGNLPATIGPGGMTLDPDDDPPKRWFEAFDAMMGDAKLHRALSKKALAHATAFRPKIEESYSAFERAITEAIARAAA
jgi:glycosyltransferase involved in cell wall biosynthesis